MLPALLLIAQNGTPQLEALGPTSATFERMALRCAKLDAGVVVVGGYSYKDRTCHREIGWLGADGRETAAKPGLSVGRNHFEMLPLGGSRLLVLGGYSEDYETLADVQAVDLKTGKVEAWPWMPRPVELFTTHSERGKLYVVGGLTSQGKAQTRSEIQVLDLQSREWAIAKQGLLESRFGHAMVYSPRLGKLIVIGGKRKRAESPDYRALASIELWEPSTGLVFPGGELPTPTDRPGALLLPSMKALIVGGASDERKLDAILEYDPTTRTCRQVAKLATPRMAPMLLPYRDRGVFIAGGWVDDAEAAKAIEYFDFATGRVATVGRAQACRAEGQMVWLDADTFALVGGKDPFLGRNPHESVFATTERFRVR